MAGEPPTLGAVYTPAWLVRRILSRSLDPLLRGQPAAGLLRLRVVDPACGQGAFLLEAGRRIAAALVRSRGAVGTEGLRRARCQVARGCLMGMDIDGAAAAATRLALLRWAAGNDRPAGTRLERALERNILAGDALMAATSSGAPGWRHGPHGPAEVLAAGGFHLVVGNPPFLEPKRYRPALPSLERLLRAAGFRTLGPGRVDLALPFLELGVALLRPGGRLGFLIQSRFFRAEYGGAARRWLVERRLLAEIEDYGEAAIFAGRATYTASLILFEGSDSVRVRVFADLAAARQGRPQHAVRLRAGELGAGPWCFSAPGLAALSQELARRHGRLGEHPIQVGVGVQLPLRSLYLLEPEGIEEHWLRGRNGLGEEVSLELGMLRPLCRNRAFYPLRVDNRDAWIIFPYRLEGSRVREIVFGELERCFPRTAEYLLERRRLLEERTALPEGPERWHLYRYPKNLLAQSQPKVLFPTTTLETAAAVDDSGEIYADNVRVLFLRGEVDRRALAALLSSAPFSALARQQAALSARGWRQLNRQFLSSVPLPWERLLLGQQLLAALARQIEAHQQAAIRAGQLPAAEARELERMWQDLDELAAELYQLGRRERKLLAAEARRSSRSELVLRHLRLRGDRLGAPAGFSPRRRPAGR